MDIFYSNLLVERSVKRILYGPDKESQQQEEEEDEEKIKKNLIHLKRLEKNIELKIIDDFFLMKQTLNIPDRISDQATLQITYILQRFHNQFENFLNINEYFKLINDSYDNRLDQIPDLDSNFIKTPIGFLNNFQRYQKYVIQMKSTNEYPGVIEWNGRK